MMQLLKVPIVTNIKTSKMQNIIFVYNETILRRLLLILLFLSNLTCKIYCSNSGEIDFTSED
jgi:hypothetical protein